MVLVLPKDRDERIFFLVGLMVFYGVIALIVHLLSDPVVLSVNGNEIQAGKISVRELMDMGYNLSDEDAGVYSSEKERRVYEHVYDPASKVKGNTKVLNLILVKGDEAHGSVTITNESSGERSLEKCKVESLTLYKASLDAESWMLNGIPMGEVTIERINEMCGEYKRQSDSGGWLQTTWRKSGYEITLYTIEEGTITRISVTDRRLIVAF